ncbi:aldose epimerase family protein [Actinoplanes palleronii]|uniref:Aldose 1-epimerase n=1 Tax=Actinoplanes palleronii TaxID=113570 RepID=A0ABQ4BH45_9ACTN|nr:aldose epimerase family protein [Actinoplanes palleronii]GIE70012.1 aldose 1-epimerase [Actinoplanes palleronii]
MTSIDSTPFGALADGTVIEKWTLTGAGGASVSILTWGATLQSVRVPDRDGRLGEVTLGFADLAGYLDPANPYFGSTVGRYANRIGGGAFTLDGTAFTVTPNEGRNTLHGGVQGFDKRVWSAERVEDGVRMSYSSPDGEEGFPGAVEVAVTFTFSSSGDRDEFRIEYHATTDRPTVVSLTNHAYWNLAGEGSGTINEHLLRIGAAHYTPVDDQLIPTGELAPVAGTPFDFQEFHAIGARLRDDHPQLAAGLGYDHNYVLAGAEAAVVRDPASGRQLLIETTEPGLQFYSGNFLDGKLRGVSGRQYRQGDAFALETQHFPDSPNQPEFPSTVLRPGENYTSVTTHVFSTFA